MKIKIFICKLWASRHAEPRNIWGPFGLSNLSVMQSAEQALQL
jgi:hypothetical protein